MEVPMMEESALSSLLVKRVKDFFRNEEHRKDFELWYKRKYGKEFDWRKTDVK